VTYLLPLTNRSNYVDSFTLSAQVIAGQLWTPTIVPSRTGTLPSGGTTHVIASVHIPTSAISDDASTAIVTATSVTSPTHSDTSVLTTTVCEMCYPYIIIQIPTGPEAREVALDIVGRRAFVAHWDGFTVINMTSYAVITDVQFPDSVYGPAYGIAYDFERDRIWITLLNADRVLVYDGQEYSLRANLPTGDMPYTIAYNPTNDRIYVANKNSSTVSVYTHDMALEQTLSGFKQPVQIAVNPDTNKIYVQNHNNNAQMAVISPTHGGTDHETYYVVTGRLDGFGVTVDTTRDLIYVASAAERKLSIMTGTTETTWDTRLIQYVQDPTQSPLYTMKVNPNVGPGGESHLYIVAHSNDEAINEFLLLPLGVDGWRPPDDAPRTLTLPIFPKVGLAIDHPTNRVWVTSVTSGLVSVIQDGVPLCPPTDVFRIIDQ
jgi:DNA-binding beta-propeller fold protein YncE